MVVWWSCSGPQVTVHCFAVCSFYGETLICARDDGVMGIIFLSGGVTVRTNMQG
jgi:hypothetical protein